MTSDGAAQQRIVLITGGTSGVGKGLAITLAKRGDAVHFVGSSAEKGRQLEEELSALGARGCRFVQCDLSSVKATQAMARRLSTELPKLDLLIASAGIMPGNEFRQTAEGIEVSLAVCYLSAYVLGTELTPLLAKGEHPQVIHVAGDLDNMMRPRPDFKVINTPEANKGKGFQNARDAVHLKTIWTQALAEALKPQGVDVNAFDPFLVRSDISKNMSFPMKQVMIISQMLMGSDVAVAGVYLATSAEVHGTTGHIWRAKASLKAAVPLRFEPAVVEETKRFTEQLVAKALATG